jgi:hypothetical protein
MKSGFYDRNGIEIETGQDVLVIDRNNNAWPGKIEYKKPEFAGQFMIEGKSVDGVFVFYNKTHTTWLNNDFTKERLEIISKKTVINKFRFIMKN